MRVWLGEKMIERDIGSLRALVTTIESEYFVLLRRLKKSGANHYAIARFDALKDLCVRCDAELQECQENDGLEFGRALTKVAGIKEQLNLLQKRFENLDDSAARTRRNRERTETLISQFLGEAQEPPGRFGDEPKRPKIEPDEGDRLRPRDLENSIGDAADVVVLSSKFVKRRASNR